MASVEQTIKPFALPEQPNIDPCLERGCDANQRVKRNAIGVAALDAADDRPRYPSL